MDKDLTTEFSAQENSKEFKIEIDDNSIQLIQSFRAKGKLGAKGTAAAITIAIGAVTLNMLFFIAALLGAAFAEDGKGWLSVVLVLLTGIIISFICVRKGYGYVFIKGAEILYGALATLMKQICTFIIDKTAEELHKQKKGDLFLKGSNGLYRVLDGKLTQLPTIAKKILWFMLKRVPFVKFIDGEVTSVILAGQKEKAATLLYTRTDSYIKKNIFEANNLQWLWWMIPLNILLQALFVYLKL